MSVRRMRILTSTVLGVFPLGYVVAVLYGERHPLVMALAQVLFVIPFAAATTGAALARRHARGAERRFWTYLALACGVLFLNEAQAGWQVASGLPMPEVIPAASGVLAITSGGLFVAMMLSMTHVAHQPALVKLRYAIDIGLPLAIGTLYVARFAMRPLLEPAGTPQVVIYLASFYSVLGLVVLIGTYTNVFGLRASEWQLWERVLVAGVSAYGLGTAAWPVWYLGSVMGVGEGHRVVEFFWVSGQAMVAMGCVYRLFGVRRARELPPAPLGRRLLPTWSYPFGLLAFAMPGALIPLLDGGGIAHVAAPAAGLSAALVIRNALTASELAHEARSRAVDALTGLPGHSRLVERLVTDVAAAERAGQELCVLVFRVGSAGGMSWIAGGQAGDERLRDAAHALLHAAEGCDVFRSGASEFAVIMGDTGVSSAFRAALHMRWVVTDKLKGITVTCGIASVPAHASSAEQLLERAREASFQAEGESADGVLVYVGHESHFTAEEERYVGMLRSLARSADGPEGSHSRDVAALATDLARRMLLPEERVRLIALAAELHDVGFATMPARRPGSDLSAEHAVLGARLLGAPPLNALSSWVLAHHEAWDGSGVPRGLVAEEIPLEARIIAAADICARAAEAYGEDAMLGMLGALRGSVLDPMVVDQLFFSLRSAESDSDTA